MPNAKVRERVYSIRPEDLLDRSPAPWDPEAMRRRIGGKVVLVTGAAGSIGSELCRQILELDPQLLVGFDQAETPLFLLEKELSGLYPATRFTAEIGSSTRLGDVNRILEKFRPSILFHAAAYKHVSMMERNLTAAVENNVIGTWRMAQAAASHGVDHFVLISTDKAVRPTSVMGATKRAAEILLRSLQCNSQTRFVAVRFGNVLGSSGSVLPLFQAQISAGGPVTITHREMERYFMTASEAGRLVLQAFTLGTGGEIFVLDMGNPIKILDLATRLIELAGLKPDRDIEIRFTGAGQGEKLFERLSLHSDSLAPTAHAGIHRVVEAEKSDDLHIASLLAALQDAAEARDDFRAMGLLQKLVPDFVPAPELVERFAANQA